MSLLAPGFRALARRTTTASAAMVVASAATGAPGDPSTATFVTPGEEDVYIHSVQRQAEKLLAVIPSRLKVVPKSVLDEWGTTTEKQDPADKAKIALVWEFRQWKFKLDQHVRDWDGRSIVDKGGRFILGTALGTIAPPAGAYIVFTVNDWAKDTAKFDKELTEWGKRLVAAGIVKASDLPKDTTERPQSILESSGDAFGVKKTAANLATDILTTVLVVGAVAGAGFLAYNYLNARIAAKAIG